MSSSSSSSPDRMTMGGNALKALEEFVKRINRLEDERLVAGAHIKDVLDEAKAIGFNKKILRRAIKETRVNAQKREEENALFDTYVAALMTMDL